MKRDREIVRSLLSWYYENGRSLPWRCQDIQPWQFVVIEMLLQQTQADRVADFVPAFFRDFATLESLADADEEQLANRMSALGLQNRRAKRLREFAAALLARGGTLPSCMEELQTFPGVGPYVAAAYLSAIVARPEPTVDVNMARIIERLYGPRILADIRYDPHINEVARRLIELAPIARDFNWAVMDIAATHCTARSPSCGECPLLRFCSLGKERVAAC